MNIPDKAVEAGARAICAALGDVWELAFDTDAQQSLCRAPDGSFRDCNAPFKDDYREAARDALEAALREMWVNAADAKAWTCLTSPLLQGEGIGA